GAVDFGEQCDDGDDIDGNVCSNDCSINCVTVLADQLMNPELLVAVNDHLIYSNDDGTWGHEFGGTPQLLLPTQTYVASSVAGRAVFFSNNGVYASDGTPDGTVLLIEGNLGWSGAMLGDQLFFGMWTGEFETWTTDGTVEGTQFAFSGPVIDAHAVMNGKLYFRTAIPTVELWETDGTEIGTQQVAVLGEDQGLIPAMAAPDDDTLVFTDELGMLWVSDGTGAGTQAIGSEVFAQGSFEPNETAFTVFNGVGYFIGELNDDWRLWRTDGTLVGTTLVLPNSQPWPLSVF